MIPCSHDMAGPQVVDGGDGLRRETVDAHVLNQQAQTVDKGRSSRLWGLGKVKTNSRCKNLAR
jgi:hypothetical protein